MPLAVIKEPSEMSRISKKLIRDGKTIALVPTMGFLHEGHLSLVRAARKKADIVVVSIFVNPTQFAPGEDLESYPRDFERDKNLLINENADFIFYPEPENIYTGDYSSYVTVGGITGVLEGSSRPAHFRGVTTIVSILFNVVQPDIAFFGRKDAQQAAVIKKMVADLKYNIEISIEPIVREDDGLAKSSRNIYLSSEERRDALVLSRSLKKAVELINGGERDTSVIFDEMNKIINTAAGSDPDYIKIVNPENFNEAGTLKAGNDYYILIACRIGKTRLIDNEFVSL